MYILSSHQRDEYYIFLFPYNIDLYMPKYFKTLNQVHNEYVVYPTDKIIEAKKFIKRPSKERNHPQILVFQIHLYYELS